MAKFEKKFTEFLEGKMSAPAFNEYLGTLIKYEEEYNEHCLIGTDIAVEEASTPTLVVKFEYFIRVCNAVLDGYIHPINLIPIGYAMWAGADCKFSCDTNDKGKRIERVMTDWGNESEHSVEMTLENVLLWRDYLFTGVYNVKWKLSYEERKKQYEEPCPTFDETCARIGF